ncbi:MAG: L,D-transpeptidase [Variibacter sp.]
MRFPGRHLFSCLLIAAATGAASTAQANILITVDKSAQRMSVAVDGVQKYSWPVSTGKSGYTTPSGKFTPFRMEVDHFSKEWDDAPMPHSIFFTPKGHAIHGSLETKRLGRAVSHGCVRLSPANAATLFALVKDEGLNKTKVVIEGGAPAPAVARRRPLPEDEFAAAPRGGVVTWGDDNGYYAPRAQPRYYGGYGGAPRSYDDRFYGGRAYRYDGYGYSD